jgi:hypothetical protein
MHYSDIKGENFLSKIRGMIIRIIGKTARRWKIKADKEERYD